MSKKKFTLEFRSLTATVIVGDISHGMGEVQENSLGIKEGMAVDLNDNMVGLKFEYADPWNGFEVTRRAYVTTEIEDLD